MIKDLLEGLYLQLLLPNQHRMPLFQLTLHHQQTFDRTCFFRFDGLLTTFHLIFPPPSTQHFIVRFSSQHFGPICVVVVVVFATFHHQSSGRITKRRQTPHGDGCGTFLFGIVGVGQIQYWCGRTQVGWQGLLHQFRQNPLLRN